MRHSIDELEEMFLDSFEYEEAFQNWLEDWFWQECNVCGYYSDECEEIKTENGFKLYCERCIKDYYEKAKTTEVNPNQLTLTDI